MAVDLFESGAVEVGVAGGRLERKPLRASALGFGEAAPLYTEMVKLKYPDGHRRSPKIEISVAEPLPCTIRAIIPEMGV